jgi:glycosyltransferase involved in cell wall biosynthesis
MSCQKSGFDVTYIGFVTGHGGDALQMLALAEGIKATGLRVKIIVPRIAESVVFELRCQAAGVECERSPLLAAGMKGPRQSIQNVLRLLRANRDPILHFHSGNSCLPRILMICLEILRQGRVVATIQSPVETITPGSLRARAWAFLANRRLCAVISPSDHGTRFQQRCGVHPARTLTIRNAIETERFATGDPSQPRAMLGLSEEHPIVLFCSRMDPGKRPVEAVVAFARVADQFPTAHLVFAGNGTEEPAVRQAIRSLNLENRAHLVGYQTNIPDWLAAATVWFLPTERENFSVALLEALAAGCAVLSTNCPGNDEVLVDDVNAITFPVGDVEAATVGLVRLLGDAELRNRLRAEAARTAARHSCGAMVNNVRAVYDRMNSSLPRA